MVPNVLVYLRCLVWLVTFQLGGGCLAREGVIALLCSLDILARALTHLISRAILKIFTIRGRGVTCEVEAWTGNFYNVSEVLIFIFLLTQSLILRNF